MFSEHTYVGNCSNHVEDIDINTYWLGEDNNEEIVASDLEDNQTDCNESEDDKVLQEYWVDVEWLIDNENEKLQKVRQRV